jgi:hypothetical protein
MLLLQPSWTPECWSGDNKGVTETLQMCFAHNVFLTSLSLRVHLLYVHFYKACAIVLVTIMASPSRAREALAARSQMGRWTHTFTRCPVSVAVRSEAKLSPTNRAARVSTAVCRRDASQTKKGISDRKTIRRISICLVRRPETGLINQWTWYRLLSRQDTPSLHAF